MSDNKFAAWQEAKMNKYYEKAIIKLTMLLLKQAGVSTAGLWPSDIEYKEDPVSMKLAVWVKGQKVGDISKLALMDYDQKAQTEDEHWKTEQVAKAKEESAYEKLQKLQTYATWGGNGGFYSNPWKPSPKLKRPVEVKSLEDLYIVPYDCGKNTKKAEPVTKTVSGYSAPAPTIAGSNPHMIVGNKIQLDAYEKLLEVAPKGAWEGFSGIKYDGKPSQFVIYENDQPSNTPPDLDHLKSELKHIMTLIDDPKNGTK